MKTLDIKKTLYRISDFLSWQKSKSLNLSPNFQRRPVWKKGAKSFLIDTMVRGLPIPIVFLREQKSDLTSLEPKREVVDGQQRLRTCIVYINPKLLKDYDPRRDDFTVMATHNKDIAGVKFDRLPTDTRQRILDYEFSVHILPSHVADSEVLEIFARMNSTGVRLTDQELRNAEYFGEFKTCMYKLASEQLERWRKWEIFTEYNIARMEEVELTSEFAIIMLKGISAKDQKMIENVYEEYDPDFAPKGEVKRRFRIVMDSIADAIGAKIKDMEFKKKTLFYSLFAIFYDLQFGLDSSLKNRTPKKIHTSTVEKLIKAAENIQKQKAPEDVLGACTRRTTNVSSRRTLLKYLKTMITNA